MSALERLIQGVVGQYRFGLHPLKLLAALLIPILIVWTIDRRLRRLATTLAEQEARKRRLPRIRRR